MKKLFFLIGLLASQSGFEAEARPIQRIILNKEITEINVIREKLQTLELTSPISFLDGGIRYTLNPQKIDPNLVNNLLKNAIENKNLFAAAVLVELGADIETIENEEPKRIVEQALLPSPKGAAGKQ